MDNDYNDVMNKGWDELPETQLTPRGTYRLKARSVAEVLPKEKGASGKVLVTYTPVEAMDDVDEAAMQAFEAAGLDVRDQEIVVTFWLGKVKDWHRLKAHIALHGVDLSQFRDNKRDALKAMKGCEIMATVQPRKFTVNKEERVEDTAVNFKAVE